MNTRLAVSLVAASLLASGSAFAQSTTAAGAANGARAGGDIAGPVGEIVGGTVSFRPLGCITVSFAASAKVLPSFMKSSTVLKGVLGPTRIVLPCQ